MAENGVLKPRLCKVIKGENGYGFHLHGKKGEVGQRIRKVEEGSAAEKAGLRVGDKIIFVNGTNVEKESHQEVVKRIKEKENQTDMLVVDEATEEYYKDKGIQITLDLLSNGTEENGQHQETPQKQTEEPTKTETTTNNDIQSTNNVGSNELRPRLCKLEKGDGGYGFNLHSEKGKPGRYIRSVDHGTPAERAGVKGGDRIIEVNGVNMEFEKHAKLVMAIKESGNSVSLLVVDEETDTFFKSCEVTITEKHLKGPLPTPKPSKEETPQLEDELMTMDLTKLKERHSSKKKRAPTSDWQNRQKMFNDL